MYKIQFILFALKNKVKLYNIYDANNIYYVL